jgi:hypothetical protein
MTPADRHRPNPAVPGPSTLVSAVTEKTVDEAVDERQSRLGYMVVASWASVAGHPPAVCTGRVPTTWCGSSCMPPFSLVPQKTIRVHSSQTARWVITR